MKNLWMVGGAAATVIILVGGAWYLGRQSTMPKPGPAAPGDQSQNQNPMNNAPPIGTEDLKVGDGAEAVAGKEVTVNYEGKLANGTKFDSSYDRGEPFAFTLGAGRVIQGWDIGVAGMKVGGKRRLVIPPELGYGAQGAGKVIPPNATLIFTVELLSVK